MRVVDAHAHLVPPALHERVAASRAMLPSIEVITLPDGATAIRMPGLEHPRPAPPAVLRREQSARWMDEQGIDHQVVGIWADLFGYRLPPAEGAAWSALANDLLLEEVQASDGRLSALASLPLQDTTLALAELDRSLASGHAGITIGPSAGVDELDAERLEPLWAALAEREVPVVMHPMFHGADPRLAAYGLPNTLGRPHDTDIAVARLLYSGRLADHPGLRILLVHGGGSLPYQWGRVERNHAIGGSGHLDGEPLVGSDALWFDTVVYRPAALELLLAFAGPDRVLLGSDYPFPIMDPRPRAVVDALDLHPDVLHRVCGANADRFFSLTPNAPGRSTPSTRVTPAPEDR